MGNEQSTTDEDEIEASGPLSRRQRAHHMTAAMGNGRAVTLAAKLRARRDRTLDIFDEAVPSPVGLDSSLMGRDSTDEVAWQAPRTPTSPPSASPSSRLMDRTLAAKGTPTARSPGVRSKAANAPADEASTTGPKLGFNTTPLARPEDASVRDKPLLRCVLSNDIAGAERFLGLPPETWIDGADGSNSDDDHGRTASLGGRLAVVTDRGLLEQRDAVGRTPLIVCARLGHVDMARLLLRAGADINAQATDGTSCLMNAVRFRQGFMTRALLAARPSPKLDLRNKKGSTALTWGCHVGNATAVAALLRTGATVNVQNVWGDTPLVWAAQQGSTGCMRAILFPSLPHPSGPVKVDKKNRFGNTALMFSATEGLVEEVKLLLRAGADRNTTNDAGDCAVTLAHKYGRLAVLKVFAASPKSVAVASQSGLTTAGHASSSRPPPPHQQHRHGAADANGVATPPREKGTDVRDAEARAQAAEMRALKAEAHAAGLEEGHAMAVKQVVAAAMAERDAAVQSAEARWAGRIKELEASVDAAKLRSLAEVEKAKATSKSVGSGVPTETKAANIAVLSARLTELESALRTSTRETSASQERVEAAEAKVAACRAVEAELQTANAKLEKRAAEAEERAEAAEAKVAACRAVEAELQTANAKLEKRAAEAAERAKAAEAKVTACRAAEAELQTANAKLEKRAAEAEEKAKAAEKNVAACRAAEAELRSVNAKFEKRAAEAEAAASLAEQRASTLRTEAAAAERAKSALASARPVVEAKSDAIGDTDVTKRSDVVTLNAQLQAFRRAQSAFPDGVFAGTVFDGTRRLYVRLQYVNRSSDVVEGQLLWRSRRRRKDAEGHVPTPHEEDGDVEEEEELKGDDESLFAYALEHVEGSCHGGEGSNGAGRTLELEGSELEGNGSIVLGGCLLTLVLHPATATTPAQLRGSDQDDTQFVLTRSQEEETPPGNGHEHAAATKPKVAAAAVPGSNEL